MLNVLDCAGLDVRPIDVLVIGACFLMAPLTIAVVCRLDLTVALLIGLAICPSPLVVIFLLAEKRRQKFHEQLPHGIDLMISILRSGLSVPQAIKAVSEEMSAPCGPEFSEIVRRVNLGQSLSQAIEPAVEQFASFDLELIRLAVALQMEVGGSLAELLEKTNGTLRRRLHLQRQVRVLTAQSRLSAVIICLMPLLVALAFEALKPGYLEPLLTTNIGRLLLAFAIILQITGACIITRLSSMRV